MINLLFRHKSRKGLDYGHKLLTSLSKCIGWKRPSSSSSTIYSSLVENPAHQPALDIQEKQVVDRLFNGLTTSHRASLAKSITLIESFHPRKRLQARLLLSKALQHCKKCLEVDGPSSASFRIGIYTFNFNSEKGDHIFRSIAGLSGPPGAGKSTFLESFGKFLTEKGEKIAVLAVDPSSTTTGGLSIFQCSAKSFLNSPSHQQVP